MAYSDCLWQTLDQRLRNSITEAIDGELSKNGEAIFRNELSIGRALSVDNLKRILTVLNAQRHIFAFQRQNISGNKSKLCKRIWKVLNLPEVRTATEGGADSGSGPPVPSLPSPPSPSPSSQSHSSSAYGSSGLSSESSSFEVSDWNRPRIIPGTNVLAIVPPIAIHQQLFGFGFGHYDSSGGYVNPYFGNDDSATRDVSAQNTLVIFPPPTSHPIPSLQPHEREPLRQLQEEGCYNNPIRDLLYVLRYKKLNVQATMMFLQSRMQPAELDAVEQRQINRRLAISEADEKSTKQKKEDARKRLWREGCVRTALDGVYAVSQFLSDAVVGKFVDDLPSLPESSGSSSSGGDSGSVRSLSSDAAAPVSPTLMWALEVREPMVRAIELECMAYKWFPGPSREFFCTTVIPRVRQFIEDYRGGGSSNDSGRDITGGSSSSSSYISGIDDRAGLAEVAQSTPVPSGVQSPFTAYMLKLVDDLEKSMYMSMGGLPPLFRQAQRELNERLRKELKEDGIEILE